METLIITITMILLVCLIPSYYLLKYTRGDLFRRDCKNKWSVTYVRWIPWIIFYKIKRGYRLLPWHNNLYVRGGTKVILAQNGVFDYVFVDSAGMLDTAGYMLTCKSMDIAVCGIIKSTPGNAVTVGPYDQLH